MNSRCAIAAWPECFQEKPSWCRNEHVCQGRKSVKRFERSNGLDTALYNNYLYLYLYLFIMQAFSVFRQYTEEKLGQAEKTELDAHFENLLQRADNTRHWTETILSNTEVVLQPNPSRWPMSVSVQCSVNFTPIADLIHPIHAAKASLPSLVFVNRVSYRR